VIGPIETTLPKATYGVGGVPERGVDEAAVLHTTETYRLSANPEEIAHLVCCRDVSWRVAFCGFENTEVNPAAEIICTMCLEEVSRLRPDFASDPEMTCPVDGNCCPDEAEIDQRIADATE
jgi:hypothetical protein